MTSYDLDKSSDLINFQREVVNYCSDNEDFFAFEEGSAQYDGVDLDAQSPDDYAEAALNHYNLDADASEQSAPLDGQYAEEFKTTAKQLQEEGFVPHAGSLTR